MPGKQILQRIARMTRDPRFAGKLVFVEDYDINTCRHFVQGVDVWLNNPRRPLEASGTMLTLHDDVAAAPPHLYEPVARQNDANLVA